MNHPWFKDFNWSSLSSQELEPPYKPDLKRWEENFDPEYIKFKAHDSLSEEEFEMQ